MFDREQNIDIVFRNGLKDFEVLPPGDIWENIQPVHVARHRYSSAIGIAAGIAVLFTLAFLASWLSKNNDSSGLKAQMSALINESKPVFKPGLLAASSVPGVVPAEYFNDDLPVIASRSDEKPIARITEPSLPSLKENDTQTLAGDKPLAVADDSEYEWTLFPEVPSGIFIPDNELVYLEKPKTKGHRFALGASLSPAYSFTESGGDPSLEELLSNEETMTSFSTGLTLAFKLSSRFSIQSGIGVSSVGQMVSGIDVFAGLSDYYAAKGNYLYSIQTASGVILSTNADLHMSEAGTRVDAFTLGEIGEVSKYRLDHVANDIRQVFRYLEVPLVIRYKVIDRKVDLNLSGGMTYGFLVENNAYADDGTNTIKIGQTEGVNNHNISSQLGLGMEYNISRKMSFNVEPVFKYYLTPFSDLSNTIARPYSFGVFSGFFFRF